MAEVKSITKTIRLNEGDTERVERLVKKGRSYSEAVRELMNEGVSEGLRECAELYGIETGELLRAFEESLNGGLIGYTNGKIKGA